jgi:hypothetical protein
MVSLIKQYRHDRAVILGKLDSLARHGLEMADTLEDCKIHFRYMVTLFKEYDELTNKLIAAINNATDEEYLEELKS